MEIMYSNNWKHEIFSNIKKIQLGGECAQKHCEITILIDTFAVVEILTFIPRNDVFL